MTLLDRFLSLFRSKASSPVALLPGPDLDQKAIATQGDPRVVSASVGYNGVAGQYSSWTEDRAIDKGFTVSTWVFACIRRIATASASVPWIVEQRNADGKWERSEGHPLELLLARPNPLQSRREVMERLTYHLYLAGNGILHKARGLGGVPRELWLLSPDVCRPYPDEVDIISHYRLQRQAGGIERLDVGDVTHVQFVNPADALWGLSPLQVAARAVDTDVAAQDWQKSSMHNRATPDGVVSFKRPLDKTQHALAEKTIDTYRSGPASARRVLVFGSDATWQQLSLSPIEMDFLNSRKMNREEICAVFQVPPPLIGLYENATLANLEASRVIFWQETVIPFLDLLGDTFTRSFGPDFEAEEGTLRVAPDLTSVPALRAMVRESTAASKTLFDMGVPFNVINQRLALGFPYVPGGDVGLVGGGLMPTAMLDPGLSGASFLDPQFAPEPNVEPDVEPEPGEEDDEEAESNRVAGDAAGAA